MKEARIWFAGDTNDNTVAWTVVKATVWTWHWGESLQPMSEWLPRFGICNVVRVLWHRDNAWYMCRKAHFWWAQRWPWKKDKTAARETLAWFSIGDFNSQQLTLCAADRSLRCTIITILPTPGLRFFRPLIHQQAVHSIDNCSFSQQKVLNIYTSKTSHLERRGEIQYLAMRSKPPFATLAVIR